MPWTRQQTRFRNLTQNKVERQIILPEPALTNGRNDMRTEVEFNHETGVVKTSFLGTVTIEEVKKAIDDVISHEEYKPGMKGIYDITNANLSEVDGEMVEELSIQIERLSKGRIGKPKVALVSENALNYGTVSLFKEYYKDLVTELLVFDSLKEAEEWLANK